MHFWLGAVAVLYVIFASVSGCAIVFEDELYRFFSPDPPFTLDSAAPFDRDALRSLIAVRYPHGGVVGIWDRRLSAGMATEIWVERANGLERRLVHPQTGEDLGDARPPALRLLEAARRLHVSVLAGSSGQAVNLAGALLLSALAISGYLGRRRRTGAARPSGMIVYHRLAGRWMCAFGVMWGVTGACLAAPMLLRHLLGYAHEPVLEWIYTVHTGAIGGVGARVLWAVAALSLCFLAITGVKTVRQRAGRMRIMRCPVGPGSACELSSS